jgi:hypothetical protein
MQDQRSARSHSLQPLLVKKPKMSVGCCGFGSRQAEQLRLLVAEQKVEIENLQRENKRLTAQIEAQKWMSQDETRAPGMSKYEMSSLQLRVRELETQLDVSTALKRDESHVEKSKTESDLRLYLERQGQGFLQRVFNQYAELENVPVDTADSHSFSEGDGNAKSKRAAMLKHAGLQKALHDLGLQMDSDAVKELFISMDLDENGGLDFEEFKRAVQQPATPLEQWLAMLPINGLLSRSFPVCGGPGDQVLRSVSKLGADEIHATVDVFSRALRGLILEAIANLQQMFSRVDEKAMEAAKGSDGAVAKFKTFKMSTGTVDDYVRGISERVGRLPTRCH